jgi:hypothetical protein
MRAAEDTDTILADAAIASALQDRELRRVLECLAASGVRPVVIKGAHLANTLYAVGRRPRSDTDLFIAPADREAAARAFASAGYALVPHITGTLLISQCHFTRHERFGFRHAYDVHWRIANPPPFAGALEFDEVAADARPVPALGAHARAPSHAHALLIACMHRVAHHGGGESIVWMRDLCLLAEALPPAERTRVVDLAARKRMLRICARELARAHQELQGDACGALARDLGAAAANAPAEPSARYLEPRSKAGRLILDLRSLPRWHDRATLLREHLFPPRSYLQWKYGTARLTATPLLYALRVARGAGRWFK